MLRELTRVVARMRRGPAVHTRGAVFTGVVRHLPDCPPWLLGVTSGTVIARLSKGAGTPGALPDVLGLALRLPSPDPAGRPWDLLLSSSGTGRVGRLVPRPSRSWRRARFTSIAPFRVDSSSWWLMATVRNGPSGASVAALRQALPMTVEVWSAADGAGWYPVARAELTAVAAEDEEPPVFDPLNTWPDGVRMHPPWLVELRRKSYEGSRAGRSARRRRFGAGTTRR